MPPKLLCAFHAQETLTNFCMNKQCLLPLCPTCVKIHSLEHMMMQTIPRYEQISQLSNQVASWLSEDIATVQSNIGMVCAAQTASNNAKTKTLQSVDLFRREAIAEIQSFCEDVSKELERLFRPTEDDLRLANQQLARNLQAIKGLRECLHGEKPMRAVIKYIGRFVRDKVSYTNKEVEETIAGGANTPIPKVDIRADPIRSLRELMHGLVKTQPVKPSQKRCEPAIIDLHEQLTSVRQTQKDESRTHITLTTHQAPQPTIQHRSGLPHYPRPQTRPTRQPCKSLSHHPNTNQPTPTRPPIFQVARHSVNVNAYYNTPTNTSDYFSNKTIDQCSSKHQSKFNTSFSGDLAENTPKSYHVLGTRRPSRIESVTISTLNNSVRDSSEEKRVKAGLMLVQQRPKNRKISFNRNIRMFKQNRDPTWVQHSPKQS